MLPFEAPHVVWVLAESLHISYRQKQTYVLITHKKWPLPEALGKERAGQCWVIR